MRGRPQPRGAPHSAHMRLSPPLRTPQRSSLTRTAARPPRVDMTPKIKNFCKFSREMDQKLIELVSDNEVLYNTNHKLYKDLSVREDVWLAISKVVGKSVQDCKTRWRSLRDLYHRKRKDEKRGKRSVTNWEYWDMLYFLDNFTNERYDRTDLKQEEDDEALHNQDMQFQNNQVNFVAIPLNESELANLKRTHEPDDIFTKRIKKDEDAEGKEEDAVQILREIRDCSKNQRHPIRTFFESMAQTVMSFPPALAAEAKLRVCQIVTELECRVLDSETPEDLPDFDS